MNESPLMILFYVSIAVYLGYLYGVDFQANRAGQPHPKAMPGATSAPLRLYVISLIGASLILGAEVGGEIALGISAEQNDMVWFFLFTSLSASIIEEVMFRGFLVVENKGRAALIASCIGFSVLFALIHPFLWECIYPEGTALWKFWLADFNLIFTTKAFFTTAILLANSLFFYALRFGSWNKNRSIFPCMLAHAASNLGVFIVKLAQGFVTL